MKPTQRNPNPVLKEKLSYNDIVWLLIPALLEAAATLGHFQTNTFLLLFKSVQIRFFCHLQKKKKDIKLIWLAPHLLSYGAGLQRADSLRKWLMQSLLIRVIQTT